ncbi:MAG TPA: tripartite tricarboxylate transporter TctB family protein [Burkholderiales bacterium]|nr:tripartite tricarboxylate transporter TctB family protein [Burkholderiales bacterium]
MHIKRPKDFWAGLMFIGFGLFTVIWSLTHYQMGTAVRMGPGYFPVLLGGLLAVLGAAVFAESLLTAPPADSTPLQLPFNIVDMAIFIAVFAVCVWIAHAAGVSPDYGMLAGAAITSVLAILYRPNAQALVLLSAACVAYGYLMKPLGLVAATVALVFVSAFGGHEFKWKEVTILTVVLLVMSVVVFVKGLTLPFPICPQFVELCPIR